MIKLHQKPFLAIVSLALCVALASGCTKSYKAKQLVNAGKRDFAAQKYDDAEIEFQSILKFYPRYGPAYAYLGLIYYDEGRLNIAFDNLKAAHFLLPQNSLLTLRMAQVLNDVGHYKDAAELAAAAMAKMPTNAEAVLAVAEAAQTAAQQASARKAIKSVETEAPSNPGCAAALGLLDLRQHHLEDAEKEFQRALQLDPKCVSARLGMAQISFSRGDAAAGAQLLRTAAQEAPPRSDARMKYIDYLLQTGSTQPAKQMLLDIAREAPDYLPASLALMHMQLSEHQFDDCQATVDKILARDPGNYDATLESGSLLLARQQPAQALPVFQRADLVYPNRPMIKYYIALASLMGGDKSTALSYLRQSISLDQNFAPAIILLAQMDVRAGDASEALALLTPLVQKDPNNLQAQLEIANAYLAQRRPDPALDVYKAMAKRFPKNPQIPFNMGVIYEQDPTRIAEAYDAYTRAWALSTNNPAALEKLIELDLRQKNFTRARQIVAQQMQVNPKASEPWMLQGEVNWAVRLTNDAINSFSNAIHLDPDRSTPYLLLARLYLDSHQQKDAINRLTMLTQKTNDVTALLELGMIHQVVDEYAAARDAYKKVLSVAPKSEVALNNLAYVESEYLNNLGDARTLAERARALHPYDGHNADTLGWILYKEGDYARALALLQEAAQAVPADSEIIAHLGMAYYMMEERDLARVYLERALASPIDFTGKKDVADAAALLTLNPATVDQQGRDRIDRRLADHPDDPVALSDLAAIAENDGHAGKAVDALQKVLSHNPNDWQAKVNLAKVYAGPLHDLRKALDFAKSAHDLAPQEPAASSMLGDLVYRSGDYAWAYDLLREAAIQMPNQAALQYDFAWAAYATGNLSQADTAMSNVVQSTQSTARVSEARQFLALRAAVRDPQQAEKMRAEVGGILQKQPDNVPAQMVMASLDEHSGNDSAARQIYEKILQAYPLFTPAMRQIAIIAARQPGADSNAYALGQKAQETFTEDPALSRALGILAYRDADYQRSVQMLRDQDDGDSLYYLGMDYYHLQQPGQSKSALTRALAMNVNDNFKVEARRVLAELK